jgi:Zn-finger nucleic acid-binding protein
MKCPKCASAMDALTIQGQDVYRCTACKGLWLGYEQRKALGAVAQEFDTGSEAVGAEFNAVDRIHCPVCPNTPLTRMVDNDQPHIWYEKCPSCMGSFFDAGEFRDLSESSLSDFFKRFKTQART